MKVSDLNFIKGSLNIFTAERAASLDFRRSSSFIEPILRFAISIPHAVAQRLVQGRMERSGMRHLQPIVMPQLLVDLRQYTRGKYRAFSSFLVIQAPRGAAL